MREEQDAIKSELNQLKDELAAKDKSINNLQKQLEEKKTAIATLKTELDNRLAEATRNETFLSKELQRFKYGVVPSEEPHGEQLQLFPTPEELSGTSQPEPETPETENTEPPAVNSEPLKANPKPKTKAAKKTKATKKLQIEAPLLSSTEGTVSVGGLMEYIKDMKKDNPNFPDPPEGTQAFTDAASGKTKRLKELEEMYSFKLWGYVPKGKTKEYRYKILDN